MANNLLTISMITNEALMVLENDEEAVWTAFVRERLRDGVNLKFLFTT